MSELEGYFVVGVALLLLTITGVRFIIQELIAAVKLFKQFLAELSEPVDTGSKNVPRLRDRGDEDFKVQSTNLKPPT